MKELILASREGGETRVCLLRSGKMVNIDAEGQTGNSLVGNIYKGRVRDINRSLNAAFVDIGTGKEGFLSVQDVHPTILKGYGRHPHIWDIFDVGQDILVQVLRDPIKDKGATLTTCLSLPGRFTVLIPAEEKTGISRKLPDSERERLRALIKDVQVPDGFGIIVRTAGQSRSSEELLTDLNGLVEQWSRIENAFVSSTGPSLLVQEQNVVIRFLREYLTDSISEVITDDQQIQAEIDRFLQVIMPKAAKNLKLYQDRIPLFTRYNVEGQIERMFLQDVPLPSGGRIVIDRTEALIAIDVNSGRTREKDVEELALKTNMEAAEEIANQLVLRDLGGLVVIDFIDMDRPRNRTKVQEQLQDSLAEDKARINLGKISQFGLLEMTRQRLRSGVVARSTETCAACGGLGYRRTVPTDALHAVRKMREVASDGATNQITVTAPVTVANYMQNELRGLVHRLEAEYGLTIQILGTEGVYRADIQSARSSVAGGTEERSVAPIPASIHPRMSTQENDEVRGRKKPGDGDPARPVERPAEPTKSVAPPTPASKPDTAEVTAALPAPPPDGEPRPGEGKARRRRSRKPGNRPTADATPPVAIAPVGHPSARAPRPTAATAPPPPQAAAPRQMAAAAPRQTTGGAPSRDSRPQEPRQHGRPQRADSGRPQRSRPEPQAPKAPPSEPEFPERGENRAKDHTLGRDGVFESIVRKLLGLDR